MSGSGLVTDCPRSGWNECGGRRADRSNRDKRLRAHQLGYAAGSCRHQQSCVDFGESGGMSRCADVCRVQCSDTKLRCDEQPMQRQRGFSKQMVDTAVSRGSFGRDNTRLRCPFGFMSSLSSIRSASSNGEVRKPYSRACQQKYRYSGPCDFICPTGTSSESRRRFTRGSCRDVFQHPLTCSTTPSRTDKGDFICPTGTFSESRRRFTRGSSRDVFQHSLTCSTTPSRTDKADVPPNLDDVRSSRHSSIDRPVRSFISADVPDSFVGSSPGSPALHQRHLQTSMEQWRPSSVMTTVHEVASSTDRPCEAFNKADVADVPPDLDIRSPRPSSTDRPVRSFISADVADSSLFGSQLSQISSTDRPARSFNSADLVDSLPTVRAPSHDSCRQPLTDRTAVGVCVDHGGPSAVGQRQWKHFYSHCFECPNCLSFALCGACNTIHEPLQNADDCLPRASDCCDRGFPAGSNESAPAIRGRYLCRNTGDEFPGACSAQNMDLHSFVDREMARAEDCRGLPGRSSVRESCYDPQSTRRDTACTRFRSLHFYTDCTDCPTCCSSSVCGSVCGSCCSVHGPPECEPADISPRCSKPPEDALLGVTPQDPSLPQALMPVDGSKPHEPTEDQLGEAPAPGDENTKPDNGDPASPDPETNLLSAVPTETPDLVYANPAQSMAGIGDEPEEEECWTWFEQACCGAIAIIILLVLLAIYLQVTRRYFTG